MDQKPFSRRHGFGPDEASISVVDDAPSEVRAAVLKIAQGELGLTPSLLRDVLCKVLRKLPDRNNWSPYPNIWDECQQLTEDSPWYRVYDFVEALYRELVQLGDPQRAQQWAELINEYFVEAGVGWRLVNGQLERRGTETFESSVDKARGSLESAGLPTARQELHEALRDLSRRPDPDLTGAVQHAMAALECAAREVAGEPRATLGEIVKRNPTLFPRPLDDVIAKMWGYASEMARHVREGRTLTQPEAELVVGVAAAGCSYLASAVRHNRGG